jgi:uncharacterized alkaline shock family protein YloU
MEKNDGRLSRNRGKTTIDPGFLIKIAKLTALSVPGVSRMAPGLHNVDNLIKKNYSQGVRIEVENNMVYAELYLILKKDVDLFKTSQTIQRKVSRAITEMVGMEVGQINIHIEDIDYTEPEPA